MTFMAWPEIESFHNIRKFIRVDPTDWFRNHELLSGTSTVTYRCKVKLHGTNAAVQVHPDGTLVPQSRTNTLTGGNDNAGFAKWVMSQQDAWRGPLELTAAPGWIVYGEWCGPGIQKGVALAEIPRRIFAVFAARLLDDSDRLIVEPDELALLVRGVADAYILPWYDQPAGPCLDTRIACKIDVNWRATDEDVTKAIAPINDWIMAIEANDPWVEYTFGVKGTGEGLVFYPHSTPHLGWENFQNLTFKAKGEAHKNIKTAAPVQVNAETVANVDSFVELVLTTARLEQGARSVGGFDLTQGMTTYDMKLTGKFVAWCLADVQKETQDELEASKLDWKQVQKPLSDKARAWYLLKSKA